MNYYSNHSISNFRFSNYPISNHPIFNFHLSNYPKSIYPTSNSHLNYRKVHPSDKFVIKF
jgi:hypothetical protein